MKLPGLAWLELSVGRDDQDRTVYHQRAIFQPRGAAGIAYWRSISPFHGAVFGGMVKNIAQAAERGGTWGAATAETAGHLVSGLGPVRSWLARPDLRSGHVLGVPRREGRGTPSRGRWAPAG